MNLARILFRFWTLEGKRAALWRVEMPSFSPRVEFHVSGPSIPDIEDFSSDQAMRRAGAMYSEYAKLSRAARAGELDQGGSE